MAQVLPGSVSFYHRPQIILRYRINWRRLHFYRNASLFTIKLRFLLYAFGVLGFLAAYKSVYIALKIGNYGIVSERLSPDNLLNSMAMGLQQFITFKILDFVVTYDFRLACSNLLFLPITIIPFMDNVFDTVLCSFNRQVQFKFFTGHSGGVAANIWAEFFANFGMLGIPLLVAVLCLVATALESVMRRVNSPAVVAGSLWQSCSSLFTSNEMSY